MSAKGGRPRKPTHLKIVEGNPGKRPLNQNEPKPKPLLPSCPNWLNKDAKAMWRRLAKKLNDLGLLTEIDGEAFTAACQSYGVWVECEKILIEKGRVMVIERVNKSGDSIGEYEQQRPEVSIGNTALKNFKGFCSEFGLSPSARSGIQVNQDDGGIEFEGLLSG